MRLLRPILRPCVAFCAVFAALSTPGLKLFAQNLPDTLPADTLAPTAPAPPSNVSARDNPNDKGGAIIVTWSLSPDDANGGIGGYKIYRATSPSGPFEEVGSAVSGKNSITDNNAEDGAEYYYRVDSYVSYLDASGNVATVTGASVPWGSISSYPQWFNKKRGFTLFLALTIISAIMFFIRKAKSGGELYIRKLAGIEAVDEAVGRATEMGKKIFFIPGIQDMNDVQTIAGIAILGRVAGVAAEYETWLEVPVCKSMVMVTARETLKEAYSRVGRPD
ncbi:MAG: DUF6754 domain-containing protein, partial [Candidatus Zixiibacteriota bacterium]